MILSALGRQIIRYGMVRDTYFWREEIGNGESGSVLAVMDSFEILVHFLLVCQHFVEYGHLSFEFVSFLRMQGGVGDVLVLFLTRNAIMS